MAGRDTKYVSMGLEWAQIDANREALFALIMEIEPNKEPTIKTVAVTIPNISGQGDPGQPLYAQRAAQGRSIDNMTIPQKAGPQMPDFTRKPGLTVVHPEDISDEQMSDVLEDIPSRRDKKKPE